MKHVEYIKNLFIIALFSFTFTHSKPITFTANNVKDKDLLLMAQFKRIADAGNTVKGQTDDVACELIKKVGKVWWHPTKKLEDVIEKPLPSSCVGFLPAVHETNPPVAGLPRVNLTVNEFKELQEKVEKGRALLEKEREATRGQATLSLEEKRQLENERAKLEQVKQQLEDLKKRGATGGGAGDGGGTGGGKGSGVGTGAGGGSAGSGGDGGGAKGAAAAPGAEPAPEQAHKFDVAAYLNAELRTVGSINDIKKVVVELEQQTGGTEQMTLVLKELNEKSPKSAVVIEQLNLLCAPGSLDGFAVGKIKKYVKSIPEIIAAELPNAKDVKGILQFITTFFVPVFGNDPQVVELQAAVEPTLLTYNVPLILERLSRFNEGPLSAALKLHLEKILIQLPQPTAVAVSLKEQQESDSLVIATLLELAQTMYTQSAPSAFKIGGKTFKQAEAFSAYLYLIGYNCKEKLGMSFRFKKRTAVKTKKEYAYPHQELEFAVLGVEGDESELEGFAQSQLTFTGEQGLEEKYEQLLKNSALLVDRLKNIFAECVFDSKKFNTDPFVNEIIEMLVVNFIVAQRPVQAKVPSEVDASSSDTQVMAMLELFTKNKPLAYAIDRTNESEKQFQKIAQEKKSLILLLKQKNDEKAKTNRSLGAFLQDVARLTTNAKNKKKTIEDLKAKGSKKETEYAAKELASLQDQIEKTNPKIEALQKELSKVGGEEAKYKKQTEELEKSETQLRKEIDSLGSSLDHDYMVDFFKQLALLRVNPRFVKLEVVIKGRDTAFVFAQLWEILNPLYPTVETAASAARLLTTGIKQQMLFQTEEFDRFEKTVLIALRVALRDHFKRKEPGLVQIRKQQEMEKVQLAQSSALNYMNVYLAQTATLEAFMAALNLLAKENESIKKEVINVIQNLNSLTPSAQDIITQLEKVAGGQLKPQLRQLIQKLVSELLNRQNAQKIIDAVAGVYNIYAKNPGVPVAKELYTALKGVVTDKDQEIVENAFTSLQRSSQSINECIVRLIGSSNVKALQRATSKTFEQDLSGMLEPYPALLSLLLNLGKENNIFTRFNQLNVLLNVINTATPENSVKDMLKPVETLFITPVFQGKRITQAPYKGKLLPFIQAINQMRVVDAIHNLNELIEQSDVDDIRDQINKNRKAGLSSQLNELAKLFINTFWQYLNAQLMALDNREGSYILANLPITGPQSRRNLAIYVALRGLFQPLSKIIQARVFEDKELDEAIAAIINQLDKRLADSKIIYLSADKDTERNEVKDVLIKFINLFAERAKNLRQSTVELEPKKPAAREAGDADGGDAPDAPAAPDAPEAPAAPDAPDAPDAPPA